MKRLKILKTKSVNVSVTIFITLPILSYFSDLAAFLSQSADINPMKAGFKVARGKLIASGFGSTEGSQNCKSTDSGDQQTCKCKSAKIRKDINGLRRRIENLEKQCKTSGRTPRRSKDQNDDVSKTLNTGVDNLKLE